jgi:hypothetical protein
MTETYSEPSIASSARTTQGARRGPDGLEHTLELHRRCGRLNAVCWGLPERRPARSPLRWSMADIDADTPALGRSATSAKPTGGPVTPSTCLRDALGVRSGVGGFVGGADAGIAGELAADTQDGTVRRHMTRIRGRGRLRDQCRRRGGGRKRGRDLSSD